MRSRQSRSSATWPSSTSLTFTTAATWTTPTVRTASDSPSGTTKPTTLITVGSRRSEAKPHWCRVRQRSPVYQLTKGAVVGVAVAPWARGSQGLEVSGHGKQRIARLLIDAPCGSMTRVTARLDHGHRHPSLTQPAGGHLGQGGADASTLRIRIDGQHPDLPDVALWVELGGDEADDPLRSLSDPDLGCVISEGVANVLVLVLPPVAMQADEDLATQALRQGAEHRRPCPQRQLDNGLLVERPIVADTRVHENPSLHRFL